MLGGVKGHGIECGWGIVYGTEDAADECDGAASKEEDLYRRDWEMMCIFSGEGLLHGPALMRRADTRIFVDDVVGAGMAPYSMERTGGGKKSRPVWLICKV